MTRKRLRDLGITIGDFPPGPHNAITDVPGVWVGHHTLIYDQPRVARTGVTVVVPRAGEIWQDYAFAAYYSFNGNGEMTGLPWLEAGMLGSAIGITNTHQVGIVRDAFVAYSVEQGYTDSFLLPVVAETYDGWLNDINAFHLTKEHVYAALVADAKPGPVAEGNVGGGTGMICHEFKGGIGTASRLVEGKSGPYTIGVLVQANYGDRALFRVDGVPVGREIDATQTPTPRPKSSQGHSIIIIIGTDAPLLPIQCKRLVQRATVGLARVGGTGHNGSGDIFLAFSTGNHLLANPKAPHASTMLPHHQLNPFFNAVAEAVEELILNALTAAETMIGFEGRTVYALPLNTLEEVMLKYRQ